jgi:cytochrome c peroxidase
MSADAARCWEPRTTVFGALALALAAAAPACHDRGSSDGGAATTLAAVSDGAVSAAVVSDASARPPSTGAVLGPDGAVPFYAQRFSRTPTVAAMTELGRRLFYDPELSASRKMSCATCHDPRFAYGPPNDRSSQLGGPAMDQAGSRAVPSLRYLEKIPSFTEHYFEEAADESKDQGPTGGRTWDGRADSAHDQNRLPLTSPLEMANESLDAVASKVEASPYAAQFREAFGDDVFGEPGRATNAVLKCLEVFQESPQDFYPYSSRYDAWLRHQVELTPAETRGLALFGDPKKANCASCHPHQMRQGAFPQFTDFGYAALGVPRNRALPANADPAFHDLGLCGPFRKDLRDHKEYCGQFRVPSLRNVALRRVFFHNGVFHRLVDVIAFYVQRDTAPAKFVPDLPQEYRANVNVERPFGGKPGGPPALTAAEIDDLLAFLRTLTDADLVSTK